MPIAYILHGSAARTGARAESTVAVFGTTRYSEVLPFTTPCPVARATKPCAATPALRISLKPGRGRSPSRHRRVRWPFRIGLIGHADLRPGRGRTPWEVIGQRNVPNVLRDR